MLLLLGVFLFCFLFVCLFVVCFLFLVGLFCIFSFFLKHFFNLSTSIIFSIIYFLHFIFICSHMV